VKILKSITLSFLLGLCLLFSTNVKVWGFTAQEIAQKTFPSVVLLVMEDANGQPLSLGSGFFVRDNIVATNFHVIEDSVGGYAKIIGKKKKYNISGTVGIDRDVDLVLLSINEAKAPFLPLGNSKDVKIGDEIYAVGNPLGLEGTFSKGIISGIRKDKVQTLMQITAPISPGSSGGAILNIQGQVVGVAVATFKEGQNLNFAIPVNNLQALLSKISRIQPLAEITESKNTHSAFDSFGERGIESIVIRKIRWDDDYGGAKYINFSIYNKLRNAVTDIKYLIIFYDDEGYPIDIHQAECKKEIPPKLAVMWGAGKDYGDFSDTKKITKAIEIRVLDFKIVE
jgi:hypothetical protein